MFDCTADGTPCADPIPAGADVRAGSAEGPFDDSGAVLSSPDLTGACDGEHCDVPALAAGTYVFEAAEHGVTGDLVVNVQ